MADVVPAKRSDETVFMRFDFRDVLASGDSILHAIANAVCDSDQNAGAVIAAAPHVEQNNTVIQAISGGVPGCIYRITVSVASSSGEQFSLDATLPVANEVAGSVASAQADPIQRVMTELYSSMRLAFPSRNICQDFQDHAARRPAELYQGVVTLILVRTNPEEESWTEMLHCKLVGQVAVREREDTPADVTEAELLLYRQLANWCRNPGTSLPNIHIHGDVLFSGQIEFPFGWVAMDLDIGPIDLGSDDSTAGDANAYPPTVTLGSLSGVDVMIDVPPFSSNAAHQQWLAGAPSAEQPDLTAIIQLQEEENNGN